VKQDTGESLQRAGENTKPYEPGAEIPRPGAPNARRAANRREKNIVIPRAEA